MHHIVHAATLPEAYHQALLVLNDYGNIRECPAYNTREKSISIAIDIAKPLEEPHISKLIPCDPAALQQYLMEMEDGIMDFEAVVTGNWPYTYHNRMISQLVEVVRILKEDPWSRRAAVTIRQPGDVDMDDPPCLQHIQYLVNDGKLDCYVLFRSNDGIKAFFMNAFALIDIQRIVAEVLDIPVGRYIHTANSFHCYENDWEKLENFSSRIRTNRNGKAGLNYPKETLTMNYKDEWQDMMLEEVPGIFKKVTDQLEKVKRNENPTEKDIFTVAEYIKYSGTLEDVLNKALEVENDS